MATRADLIEIPLAGLGVTDQNFELYRSRIPAGRAALPARRRENAMDVLGDRDGVRFDQVDLGIVIGHRFSDQLAVLIVQRGERPEQARALLRSAHIGRVARRAVGFVQALTAGQHVLGSERPCELREAAAPRATSAALAGLSGALSTAASAPSRWRSGLLTRRRLRQQRGREQTRRQ